MARARRDLGYAPTYQNDMTAAVQFLIDTGHKREPRARAGASRGIGYWIVNIVIMFMFASLIMACIPIVR